MAADEESAVSTSISVTGEADDEYQLVSFAGRDQPVRIDLCYNESAMRPLFDGAGINTSLPLLASHCCILAWAGSMVWGCSVVLAEYILETYSPSQLRGKRAIELG